MPAKQKKRLYFLIAGSAVILGGMGMLWADSQPAQSRAQDSFAATQAGDFFSSSNAVPGLPVLPLPDGRDRDVRSADGVVSSSPLPDWTVRQEPSAEGQFAWALWQIATKPADAAKSVAGSLGEYVKVKQKQLRQDDLVKKFYTNLDYVLGGFHLQPAERDEITARVKRVYMEDGQSGRYRLDTLHFRELPYIVRMQYGEMMLGHTHDGTVDTYYPRGAVKTRWILKDGRPDGTIVTYYENGEILYLDYFKNGQKVLRKKFNAEGKMEFEQNYDYSLPAGGGKPAPVPEVPPLQQVPQNPPALPMAAPVLSELGQAANGGQEEPAREKLTAGGAVTA